VRQQVRDKSRLAGLDTVAENADVRAFVWQRVCQRSGLQGRGRLEFRPAGRISNPPK
jgi:hypothetical protein